MLSSAIARVMRTLLSAPGGVVSVIHWRRDIETPRGPYYIKLTGPAKTVDAAGADFQKFLSTVRYQ